MELEQVNKISSNCKADIVGGSGLDAAMGNEADAASVNEADATSVSDADIASVGIVKVIGQGDDLKIRIPVSSLKKDKKSKPKKPKKKGGSDLQLYYCCFCTIASALSRYPGSVCEICGLTNMTTCLQCSERKPELCPPTRCYKCANISADTICYPETKKGYKRKKWSEPDESATCNGEKKLCPCGFASEGVCKKMNANHGRPFISCNYCDYFRWNGTAPGVV